MPNRLIDETSPYLLQHANNPVDWYAWGDEALARARAEDKPIMLSIGYSACHWCHVMEHESFEDPETARLMNENFVNIKVDREERPDLDSIYMAAVQAMTGHGGWPMTVFLTPDQKPFFTGTYFPKEDRYGMPSFKRVLLSVAKAYREQRREIEQQSAELVEYLDDRGGLPPLPGAVSRETLEHAVQAMMRDFEPRHGGFGSAPKFPQPMDWEFLLLQYSREPEPRLLSMIRKTLDNMARGGIYDQLGGGFHRYSVDAQWLVPHFEKMLYDNALLARLYLHAYQVTGEGFYREVTEDILSYVAREMTSPEGGFYSTQDADSEGEEGKFYVWTVEEVEQLLGAGDARIFMAYFDVTPGGNFEGHNILNVRRPAADLAGSLGVPVEQLEEVIAAGKERLFAAREQRVHPGRDEKVLVSWNGLMMRAFAEAARVLGREDYQRLAEDNAHFILDRMRQDGRLFRTYKDGRARLNGYLEDYAFYAAALLELYQTTFDPRWFEEGRALADRILDDFVDEAQGGFFDTAAGHERLITRPKDMIESAIPSGNSVAVEALLRLHRYTMDDRYYDHARRTLEAAGPLLDRYPRGMGQMLWALDSFLGASREIAVIGDPAEAATRELLDVLGRRYAPHDVVAAAAPGDDAVAAITLLQDRPQQDGRPTVYVCQNYACQMPVTTVEGLRDQLT